jgi:iron(III) transport system substrate-binding protein
MSEMKSRLLSRSKALGLLAGSGFALTSGVRGATAAKPAGSCDKPQAVAGLRTCANLGEAEKEGMLVGYSADVEALVAKYQKSFQTAFPKIDSSQYVRLASGPLYTKLLKERGAGVYTPDIFISSDCAIGVDLQKRGGLQKYVSPELASYEKAYQSDPPGFWTQYQLVLLGIAYNSEKVPDSAAPKSFKDLTNPMWRGKIGFKDAASGAQQVQWYVLRQLYGDKYWEDIAAQKPHAVASAAQQYQRLLDGEDVVLGMAQYNTYLSLASKTKNLPIKFVFPREGLIYAPLVIGVPDRAPHPEAAKLFIDYMLSAPVQQQYANDSGYYSPLNSVAPPPGGPPLRSLKLYRPDDWGKIAAANAEFNQAWRSVAGL